MDQKIASMIVPAQWDYLDTLLEFIRTQTSLRSCSTRQALSLEGAVEAFFQEMMYSSGEVHSPISCFFQGDTLAITPVEHGAQGSGLPLGRFPQLELSYSHPTYRFKLL